MNGIAQSCQNFAFVNLRLIPSRKGFGRTAFTLLYIFKAIACLKSEVFYFYESSPEKNFIVVSQ